MSTEVAPPVAPSGEDRRVSHAPRVIGRRVHGQMVVVRLPTLDTRVLNEVGARVWELADGRAMNEIASALALELHEPLERIAEDVRAFVDALVREDLLRVSR